MLSIECHIELDWLLVYQYEDDKLNLLLITTGSRSELFRLFVK
ncbi:MAG: type II toxin-antitoxin system mRNA interferase toxin, RelE/StbE family [Bacilli bacterium]